MKQERNTNIPEIRKIEFAFEWMRNGYNGTKAAEYIGYSAKNASAHSYYLLRDPFTQSFIARKMDEKYAKMDVDVDKVVQELAKIAFIDVESPHCRYTTKDKIRSLELIGKHLQMFIEKVEVVSMDKVYESISQNAASSPKHAIKH